MITEEQIEAIERIVAKKAEETAYHLSEQCENRQVQLYMYEVAKKCIIYGSRLYQEELINTLTK
jgi:hypothetical protein